MLRNNDGVRVWRGQEIWSASDLAKEMGLGKSLMSQWISKEYIPGPTVSIGSRNYYHSQGAQAVREYVRAAYRPRVRDHGREVE